MPGGLDAPASAGCLAFLREWEHGGAHRRGHPPAHRGPRARPPDRRPARRGRRGDDPVARGGRGRDRRRSWSPAASRSTSSWRSPTCRSRRSSPRSSCSSAGASPWASTAATAPPVRSSASPRRSGRDERRCPRWGCPVCDDQCYPRSRVTPQRDVAAARMSPRRSPLTQSGNRYCGSSSSRSSPSRSWPPSTRPRPCGDRGSCARPSRSASGRASDSGSWRSSGPPSRPPPHRPTSCPSPQAAFRTSVGTGVELQAPAIVGFSTPMERASVEAALVVEPATAVELRWNDDDTAVTIVPVGHWAADTYHTITVQPGALAGTGRPLTKPVRAAFLTRGPTTAGGRGHGQARQAGRARDRVLHRVRSRRRRRERGQGRPARSRGPGQAHGRVGRRRPAALRLHAEQGRSRPTRATRSIVEGVRDARRRPRRADRHGGQDHGRPGGRPLPAGGAHAGRGARHGHLGALQPDDGPRLDEEGLQGARGRQADQGQDHVRREGHGPGLRSGQVFAYDTRVVATVARSARSADGVPLKAAEQVAFRTELEARRTAGRPATRRPAAAPRAAAAAVAPSAAAAGRRSSATTWA